MFPVFDIAIDKLRIQAAKKDAAMIATDLQNGGWHTGEQRQWVFIRQLGVSSPKNGLRLNTSRHIRCELERAVHGASHNAHNANAVRFSSLADMLTFLVRDLAEGRTRSWYWEKWSHLFYLPKSEAITQLLWDNISEAAEIFQTLASIGALQQVWQQLSLPHVEILLARLASVQNISPQALSPAFEVYAETQPKAATFSEQERSSDLEQVFQTAESIVSEWRKIFALQSALDAKFYFAAAVTSVALAPQAMMQRPQQVVAAFYRSLTRTSVSSGQTKSNTHSKNTQDKAPENASSSSMQWQSEINQAAVEEKRNDVTVLPAKGKISGNDSARDLERKDSSSSSKIAVNESSVDTDISGFEATQATKHFSSVSAISEDNTENKDILPNNSSFNESVAEEREEYQFYTQLGGIFYLINAINHPESYAFLREEKEWMQMVSGWTLVHNLAQKLGANLDQALLRFFADVAGLPSVGELKNYQHPQLVKILLPLFQQRYAKNLRFDSSLVHVPARVSVSYSHVSVDYDMQSIRLPVRLCGLDVDPGWIPWLGRVVRFHFLDDVRLKERENNE